MNPILVTGGTGTLGRLVVVGLREAGRNIRVLSRHEHAAEGITYLVGDLLANRGIEPALQGVEIVIHCAGGPKGDDEAARNLVDAARRAGVRHLVHMSVVGVDKIRLVSGLDRTMFGYFGAKLAAEKVVAESGIPWTILRATQFHELLLVAARQMSRLPLIPVPAGFRFQPIGAAEVAKRLVELALALPTGQVEEMAGPQVYEFTNLVRSYLAAAGLRRLTLPIRFPGKAAASFRAGANLALDRAVGEKTWEDFLNCNVPATTNDQAG